MKRLPAEVWRAVDMIMRGLVAQQLEAIGLPFWA